MSIEDVYKKVATKHNITEETARQVHVDFFKGVKKIMQGDTGKDILVNGFGTFYFDRTNLYAATQNLKRRINGNEKFLKNGGDWMRYLYIYRNLAYRQRQIEDLWTAIDKRANRKLGERGL